METVCYVCQTHQNTTEHGIVFLHHYVLINRDYPVYPHVRVKLYFDWEIWDAYLIL